MIASRGPAAFSPRLVGAGSLLVASAPGGTRERQVAMAEDVTVSEETLTSSLSLLVNLGKVLLEKAKQEAAGRTDSDEGCILCHGPRWKCEGLSVFRCTEKQTPRRKNVFFIFYFLWRMSCVGLLSNSALRRYTNAFFYAFLILYITALSAYLKKRLTQ